jgi:hypothetical protein
MTQFEIVTVLTPVISIDETQLNPLLENVINTLVLKNIFLETIVSQQVPRFSQVISTENNNCKDTALAIEKSLSQNQSSEPPLDSEKEVTNTGENAKEISTYQKFAQIDYQTNPDMTISSILIVTDDFYLKFGRTIIIACDICHQLGVNKDKELHLYLLSSVLNFCRLYKSGEGFILVFENNSQGKSLHHVEPIILN